MPVQGVFVPQNPSACTELIRRVEQEGRTPLFRIERKVNPPGTEPDVRFEITIELTNEVRLSGSATNFA